MPDFSASGPRCSVGPGTAAGVAFYDGAVRTPDVQQGRGVDVSGIHHSCHPLQGRDDHGLLPGLEVSEPLDEMLLQSGGGLPENVVGGIGQVGVNAALVLCAALPVEQTS